MRREYLVDRPDVSGRAGSTWLAERERSQRGALTGAIEADVCVVGAGLCGTLTAWRLARSGARVVLLDARRTGSGVSGHTTAKATAQHGLVAATVPSHVAERWLMANIRAVDELESMCAAVGEPAGFERVDSHVYVTAASSIRKVEDEAGLYRDAGVRGGVLSEPELPKGALAAIRLEQQGQFDPVGLMDGLIDGAPAGLVVFEGSHVQEVEEEGRSVVTRTHAGEVRSDAVVLASHVPFFDTILYMTRLFQERSYAFELVAGDPPPRGMWYGLERDAVSWRSARTADPSRLIVSGAEHKAGQGGDERACYGMLETMSREMFGGVEVVRHWSTQDAGTPDGLPFVGRMLGRERCFMASGFQGWGMTTSVLAAEVLADLVGGSEHELADMLGPARVGTAGMGKLAVENADFMAKAMAGEFPPQGNPDDIGPGEGRAMRTDLGHVAVSRTRDGETHINNAHCTHMRCGVEFNEAEETWDCPCHGSRFLSDGSWLHGPTRRGLDPVTGGKLEDGG